MTRSVSCFFLHINNCIYTVYIKLMRNVSNYIIPVACPGIRKGGGGGGGGKSEMLFFAFQFFKGGPAQKIALKMIFPTKKVGNYR